MSQDSHRTPAASRGCGPIEIRLPADPDLVSAMRLTASAMAASAECTVDEIDDVKLAVSEVLLALIEHGSTAEMGLTLHLADSNFTIVGRCETRQGRAGGRAAGDNGGDNGRRELNERDRSEPSADVLSFDPDHPDLALSRIILAEICSTHSIDLFETEMRISATIHLRASHDRPGHD